MLEEYKKKRDFSKTKEPAPKVKTGGGALTFVVQKHSARRLHYDFRLEVDGVLKSWAIPNGISFDPSIKRLAVMVEDHPLDYGGFEGSIPEGEYGAGQVIIWDRGVYSPDEKGELLAADREQAQEIMRSGLEKGKISFFLKGEKLNGSWALVRMAHQQKNWLMIKHRDQYGTSEGEPPPETSVLSGLTLEDVKAGRKVKKKAVKLDLENFPGVIKAPFPDALPPMLATLAKGPFSSPDWIFEPKLDGFRILAFIRNGKVKLQSRRGFNISQQYPLVVKELEAQSQPELVLDGEVVALDESGLPCFQCLQNHLNRKPITEKISIFYYVFDLLYLNGYDLQRVPLVERKKLLEQVFSPSAHVKAVEYFESDGTTVYETSINLGLEGVMGKSKKSLYEAGRRSQDWLKIKSHLSDEFVIGGYTQGEGARSNTFGSLLLGQYDDKGKLVYTGNAGSGFDESSLDDLLSRLKSIKSTKNPFESPLPPVPPVTFVKPELVAEVKYAERTVEGYLRQPVFMRLREDKAASEVDPPASVSEPRKDDMKKEKKGEIEEILEQLKDERTRFKIEVEGHTINITNPDKELWPTAGKLKGHTKRDLLVYLTKISPYMLPHVTDRPITLRRFPNGITGERFYQKHLEDATPEYVKTVPLSEHGGAVREYIVCNNLPTLLWLAQLANIDIHTWFSRIAPGADVLKKGQSADALTDYPDFIIFDIDPYIYSGKEAKGEEPELNREAFKKTCEVALWLKEVLDGLKMKSFVKTSGRTGLHIFAPILRHFDFGAVHEAAKTITTYVNQKHPRETTIDWAVEKRAGKIFLDYNQNVRGKTLASVYSPRPAPEASVSAPLRWEELGKVYPTDFTLDTFPARAASLGDLWAGILEAKADLGKMVGDSSKLEV